MNDTHFVLFSDGHYENGDIGWAQFPNEKDAMRFIEIRMKQQLGRKLNNYTYIVGNIVKLVAVEQITQVVPETRVDT